MKKFVNNGQKKYVTLGPGFIIIRILWISKDLIMVLDKDGSISSLSISATF
jgi:hypothetical protein